MPVNLRIYGKIREFTEFEEHTPSVRVSSGRQRSDVFEPRRSDNVRRTRTICVRRVLSAIEEIGTPLLVTLTFRGIATEAYQAGISLRDFQVRLRSTYPGAHAINVPELSPRGRIHFHGLLFGLPLSWGDVYQGQTLVSYGSERTERNLARIWRQGYVDVRQTDGDRRLAYYISKYISKGAGEAIFQGMRLVRTTKGFPNAWEVKNAGWIQRRFKDMTPIDTWEINHPYLGKIKRTRYELQ